ncbi:DDB1- and CUL4-associated factor 12 [Dissophora globulifera]|uniref:DDB1- and CUL4-associated factor 12 n=1 Tax=Dissophora globulifera TaxID=979702 RepID=A0A9P6UXG3_9FUNG|nr:DDB1- and CUL4-associated factor 12 [Dissophora globulifera]
MPPTSVLGPLRKREYQTRQQQIRLGTHRRIGCTPRQYSESRTSEQTFRSSSSSKVGSTGSLVGRSSSSSSNSNDDNATRCSGLGVVTRELGARSTSNTSNCPPTRSLAMSITPASPQYNSNDNTDSLDATGEDVRGQLDQTMDMDWSPVTTSNRALSSNSQSPSSSLSSSPSIGSFGKAFMLMGQVMEFAGGSSSAAAGPGSSSMASGSSSGQPYTLRNSHLSSPQLGVGGRRMSTPSMSTTSPYGSPNTGSSSPSSQSCVRSNSSRASRTNYTISGSRTWVASMPSTDVPASDEFNGYALANCGSTTNQGYYRSSASEYASIASMDIISSRIPLIISEREYRVQGFDKAFAATWITHEEVLMGTKCNKIIMLNTCTDRRVSIARLDQCLLESVDSALARVRGLIIKQSDGQQPQSGSSPPLQIRRLRGSGGDSLLNSNSSGGTGLGLSTSLEMGRRFFNAGRRSSTPSFPSPPTTFTSVVTSSPLSGANIVASPAGLHPSSAAVSPAHNNTNSGGGSSPASQYSSSEAAASTGIRSMSINPSRTLLAIGSGDPFQVTIYALPELEPVGMMYGHTDLVFSLTWITDTVLATGARDGSMRVWSMNSPVLTMLPTVARAVEVRQPILTRMEEKTKVRDLALNQRTGISKLKLIRSTETVCLTANAEANLFAVGSQNHVSIIDPRTSSNVHEIESRDEGWGVRSLDFRSHIVTTGGGYGRLGFYDLRAQKYLDGFDSGASNKTYLEIGPGWLNRDTAYAGTIAGITIRNAVYAMEYDSTGTRLFTAGGPLQVTLCGAYAGLWS